MEDNYVIYHLHTEDSLLDSCTDYKLYVDKAVDYGMKAIGFSEHGNIYNWIEKKMYCDKKGIKYIHGCEVYLTEKLYHTRINEETGETEQYKVRDNFHTILIGKNEQGIKELNELIGNATDTDHMYYKPRITFDEFFNISDNILKISACLASPLNKLSEDNENYEKLLQTYDFYEIQYHNDIEQIEYNRKLYELSKKYNKKLIAGTDTHNLNQYMTECRKVLKLDKNSVYENEDNYDLTFKSYDELIEMFDKQQSLDNDIILEAIHNTNMLLELCDDVVLDMSVKYPKMSDNDEELFVQTVLKKTQEKIQQGIIEKDTKYLEQIKEEIRVFKKINMCSFMLFMGELISWCKNNGIPVGFCRGSCGGSLIAYILDIIDLNPIKWKTIFSRFCNEDRVEVGDIDVDISPSQRELVYDYIIRRFGLEKTAYILSMGTLADKGTIDSIGRALTNLWQDEKNVDKIKTFQTIIDNKTIQAIQDNNSELQDNINKYFKPRLQTLKMLDSQGENPYSLSNIANIKKEYEADAEETKLKYYDIFYYFDGLVNTKVSQSMHPAGIIVSPTTLHDNYGCFWNKDGQRILYINMEEVHECGLVKYDILGLKNIEIIKDTCELVGIPYPKSHEIDWDDEEVWKHITDSPVGIFQFESNFAYDLLKKYQPRKINDLSLVNACLRPSGTSYRDRLINREFNHNPSELIDDLLRDNQGFLVFQEDTLAFLQQICGLSGSEADNIRRAIGRKQRDRLEKALPSILEGYCAKSPQSREVAEKEAQEFLQILEDSAEYQFGYNHSTGYSMIGYYCGYLRYYYPVEFVTAYLNNANNDDDIIAGTQLAQQLDIKIKPPRFRYSQYRYFPDTETRSIYKGISSIKFCNETIGKELYSLKDNSYNDFVDILLDIKEKTSVNSKQLSILIKLNYFEEFGKRQYLLRVVQLYEKLATKKQFKKQDFNDTMISIIRRYADKETAKMFKEVDTIALTKELISHIKDVDLPIKEILFAELDYLGYLSHTDETVHKDVIFVSDVNINKWGNCFVSLYRICDGKTIDSLKVDKNFYLHFPLDKGSIINVKGLETKPRKRKDETTGKWVETGEYQQILTSYEEVLI